MYISPRLLCYFSGCARYYFLLKKRIYIYAFNITIIQVYAPTSSYADSEVDEFYRELQSLVDQTAKHDILVVQGDWNAKLEKIHQKIGEMFVDLSAIRRPMTGGSSS